MPGVPEISRAIRLLRDHLPTNSGRTITLIPLHGNLSPAEQKRVFNNAGPNELKLVISTNVAEASVTIPDVVRIRHILKHSFYTIWSIAVDTENCYNYNKHQPHFFTGDL
jgi:hypothetical protein